MGFLRKEMHFPIVCEERIKIPMAKHFIGIHLCKSRGFPRINSVIHIGKIFQNRNKLTSDLSNHALPTAHPQVCEIQNKALQRRTGIHSDSFFPKDTFF